MKRAKRNRRLRIAASIVLALFFVLWISSFTTAVARFDSHSIFIFAQGKLTLITSEDVLFEHRGQDIHQVFVGAADGLVDRETASDWYFTETYDMAFPLPAWDFAVVDVSRLFEWDFWHERNYGVSLYRHEFLIEPVVFAPAAASFVRYTNRYHIPVGTTLLITATAFGLTFWITRSFPPGHCKQCNYDLYKNTSNTCPECGTAITAD